MPWFEDCPMPTRCALLVALSLGITMGNVFLAGGRMDDMAFFSHRGCEQYRRECIAKVVPHRPGVIVEYRNAHALLETEQEIYSLDSDYAKIFVSHASHHAKHMAKRGSNGGIALFKF